MFMSANMLLPSLHTSSANLEREDAAFISGSYVVSKCSLMYWGVQAGKKDSISTNNYLLIIIQLHLVDRKQ
jgi:hypothetical protein